MKRIILIAIALLFVGFTSALAGGQPEGVVLNFPTFWVGQDSKAEPLAELIAEFNAQYEGQIQVVIEESPDTDGYRDVLNAQLSSGSAPDLFVLNVDPTTIQYYDSDVLFDFTPYLDSSWAPNFVPGYIDTATRNGATKSIPYEIAITPVWYNQNHLNGAGWNAPPTTIDDFWAMTEDLKANGVVPTSQMTGGSNAWTSMLWYSHIMGSLGGPNVWDRPLGDPLYAEAAGVLKELFLNGNTTRDAVGGDAGVSGGHYLAGTTAAFINGPWYVGRIRGDAPEIHAATTLASAPQVGQYSGHQVGFPLSNLAAGNTDDPAKAEAIVTFMKFMTEPANVQQISEVSGSLFAVQYELSSNADPLTQEFVRAASEAEFVIGHFASVYSVEVVAEFGQALGALVQDATDEAGFVQMLLNAQ